ncbi:hypothetical protein U1Q18_035401 [Sarracenia purpurea var. burkii]
MRKQFSERRRMDGGLDFIPVRFVSEVLIASERGGKSRAKTRSLPRSWKKGSTLVLRRRERLREGRKQSRPPERWIWVGGIQPSETLH